MDFVCLVDGIACLLNIPKTSCIVRTKLGGEEQARHLLIVGHNMSDTTEFALEADALGVVLGGQNGVKWCAALGVCIVMVVKEITIAVVVPSGDRVDKSRLIQVANGLGEHLFRVWWATQLSPSLVVNDPLNNGSVTLVLIDEDFKLALELLLLLTAWLRRRGQTGHVLDYHQADFITGLIEKSRLDFDLICG